MHAQQRDCREGVNCLDRTCLWAGEGWACTPVSSTSCHAVRDVSSPSAPGHSSYCRLQPGRLSSSHLHFHT
jgi:hypothetical protein